MRYPYPSAMLSMILLASCTSPEKEKTTTRMGIYVRKEIKFENHDTPDGPSQSASIVDGDSTLFVYSRYTDYGEEGSGFKICFYIPARFDSIRYTEADNPKLIIRFGTGLGPSLLDTLSTYAFSLVDKPAHVEISGKVGEVDISGKYPRLMEVRK